MVELSLRNPLFATYVIAATLMILKVASMSWLTVVRMMQEKGGFRAPEDLRKTPFNPEPNPKQIEPNERVERIRRIQLNDLENIPFFLIAGLLFVLCGPPLLLAQWLLYGYVVSRLAHFAAYFTAQTHEVRATFWTIGSFILIFMTGWALLAALGVIRVATLKTRGLKILPPLGRRGPFEEGWMGPFRKRQAAAQRPPLRGPPPPTGEDLASARRPSWRRRGLRPLGGRSGRWPGRRRLP